MSTRVLYGDLSNGLTLKLSNAQVGKRLSDIESFICLDEEQFLRSLSLYIKDYEVENLGGAIFSHSGWIDDDAIQLVQYGFKIHKKRICDLLNIQDVTYVNHFVSKAYSIAHHPFKEGRKIFGNSQAIEKGYVIIGPSHGFGVSLAHREDDHEMEIHHCEGGHAILPIFTDYEIELFKYLRNKFTTVTNDMVLSEKGLPNLWEAVCMVEGRDRETVEVEEILALLACDMPLPKHVLSVFSELYANVVFNSSLILGARGGIYLAGNFFEQIIEGFDAQKFSARLEDKGVGSLFLHETPIYNFGIRNLNFSGMAAFMAQKANVGVEYAL